MLSRIFEKSSLANCEVHSFGIVHNQNGTAVLYIVITHVQDFGFRILLNVTLKIVVWIFVSDASKSTARSLDGNNFIFNCITVKNAVNC